MCNLHELADYVGCTVYKMNIQAWNDIVLKKITLLAESITHDEDLITYSTMDEDQPSVDTEVETSTLPTVDD